FFFQAEDGIRDKLVTGVQTCALPISNQTALYSYTQGLTRSWTQPSQPGKGWAADSRCNLASVSKFITAVAIVKFLPTISKTINEIGRASCRERVEMPEVARPLEKKTR